MLSLFGGRHCQPITTMQAQTTDTNNVITPAGANTPGYTYTNGLLTSVGGKDINNPLVAPSKPVSAITTQQGVDALQKVVDQHTRLAGTPPTTPTTPTGPAQPTTPTQPTTTQPTTPTPTPTKITLINPATEQTVSFNGDDSSKDSVQGYLDAGYHLSEVEGNTPSWLTPSGTVSTGNPAVDAGEAQLTQAKNDLAAATAKLTNFDVSNDPQLKTLLSGITAQWDQRITQLQNAEDSRVAALETTGLRMGSMYTGGAGGVTGSIVSAEEKNAVDQIASLQAQKQQALAAAQSAYENGQWSRYSDLVNIAQKADDQQLSAVTDLQKAQATQDQKIQDQIKASNLSHDISKLYAAGTTDPSQILESLRTAGNDTVTLNDVSSAIKDMTPTAQKTDEFKFSQPQQSQLVAAGLTKEEMQALHDFYNGTGDSSALTDLTPDQQTAVHDALNGTAAKKAASTVPTYAQLHPKPTGGTTKPYVSGGLTYTQDTLSNIQQKITASKGADGYVDPYLYKGAFDAWLADGGLAKDFTKNFPPKSYINPKADWLPQYLASKTATTKEAVNPFK